jgi:hypothetical protein
LLVLKAQLELQDLEVFRVSQGHRGHRDHKEWLELACQDQLDPVCQDLPVIPALLIMSVTTQVPMTEMEVVRRCVLIHMTATSASALMVLRFSMSHILAHHLKDAHL